jgi:hypothetical protein
MKTKEEIVKLAEAVSNDASADKTAKVLAEFILQLYPQTGSYEPRNINWRDTGWYDAWEVND